MSKFLSPAALKTLNRIGDIIAPRNGDFPSYSEYGCVEHVDDVLAYIPENDAKDLNTLLQVLAYSPDIALRGLVKFMTASHEKGDSFALFRMLDFGLRGIILSTYYSDKKGSGYTGKTPLEVIDFSINRIPLGKEKKVEVVK